MKAFNRYNGEPNAEKNQYGAWVISDIVRGAWVHKQYYGYTKRDAIRDFKREHKAEQ